MELTKEQEAALIRLADAEIAAAPKREALAQAEAALQAVTDEVTTARQVEATKMREALKQINLQYGSDILVKQQAVATAKVELEAVKPAAETVISDPVGK